MTVAKQWVIATSLAVSLLFGCAAQTSQIRASRPATRPGMTTIVGPRQNSDFRGKVLEPPHVISSKGNLVVYLVSSDYRVEDQFRQKFQQLQGRQVVVTGQLISLDHGGRLASDGMNIFYMAIEGVTVDLQENTDPTP